MKTVGFIGLGSQGAPMAQRLIDGGYSVLLWARREETLQPFVGGGALIAQSVEELGSKVECCGVCVVDDVGVQQVCDRLIPAMAAGSCIVIHSTVTPALCQQLNDRAKQRGIQLLDAPVSGGGQGAAEGRLTLMVGGDKDTLEQLKPLFAAFSHRVFHMGKVGTGQQAKLVNNNLMAANLALANAALAMADALGIEQQQFVELVKTSSGHSVAFDVRARMSAPTDFSHGAALLMKDITLLGNELAENAHYRELRGVSEAFLQQALKES